MAPSVDSSSAPPFFGARSRRRVGPIDLVYTLLIAVGFAAPLTGFRVEPLGSVVDALLIAAVLVVLVRQLVVVRPILIGPYAAILGWIGALCFFGVVGTIGAEEPFTSLANALRMLVSVGGLLILVADVRPTSSMVRRMVWAYVFGASMNCVAAIFDQNEVTGRSSGWSSHPNVLGTAAALGVILGIALAVGGTRRARMILVPVFALLLIGINLSGSRAALLICVLGAVMFFLLLGQFRSLAALALALTTAAALVLTGQFGLPDETAIGRAVDSSGSGATSDVGRAELASTVIERIEGRPVFGSGFARATEAHNIYLQILDIAGVFGLIAAFGLVASVARLMLPHRGAPICAAGLAILAAYLASGIFVNSLWDRWLWFPIVCGLAAAVAIRQSVRHRGRPPI